MVCRFASLAALALAQASAVFLKAVSWHQHEEQPMSYGHPAWLNECRSIYLDVGANMGVQVRKLFEPEQYPGADIAKAFDRIFGPAMMRRAASETSGICALGVEPNPEHSARLQSIEEAYASRGWNVHFYPFAAWGGEGHLGFNMTGRRDNVEDGTNVDAHLNSQGSATLEADYMVRTIDFADFVSTLPLGTVKLMKMDVEGAEYETLASMLHRSVLCSDRVAEAFIEVHPWGEVTEWVNPLGGEPFTNVHPRSFAAIEQRLGELSASNCCGESSVTHFSELDDETYTTDVDDNFANLASLGHGKVFERAQL